VAIFWDNRATAQNIANKKTRSSIATKRLVVFIFWQDMFSEARGRVYILARYGAHNCPKYSHGAPKERKEERSGSGDNILATKHDLG